MRKKNVIYAILNWGLGHSTRSIPLIKALLEEKDVNSNNKYKVTIVSTGRSLNLLKKEFPRLDFIDLPDYNVKYSKKGSNLIFYIALQLPSIIYNLFREKNQIEKIVKEQDIDIIISDNRYGVFSTRKRSVKNYFITHQLRFKLPQILSSFEFFSEYFNRFFFRYYNKVFVMDNKEFPFFSADLSHKGHISQLDKIKFIGLFSDTTSISNQDIEKKYNLKEDYKEDLDFNKLLKLKKELHNFLFVEDPNSKTTNNNLNYLAIISGPEPQRTIFEEKIVRSIEILNGKKIVILGLTEKDDFLTYKSDSLLVFNHLPREIISDLINLTELIICRSGYSTVMELVSLNKKALMIPTPGQTEQEYLSNFYLKQNLFYSVEQEKLELVRDVEIVKQVQKNSVLEDNNLCNQTSLFLEELE